MKKKRKMNILREHLSEIKRKKTWHEKIIDDALFIHKDPGSGKLLRCITRHWDNRADVWKHLFDDPEHIEREWPQVKIAFDAWMDLHEEYEFMITQDADIHEEVRMDRLQRALKDAQNWLI